MYVLKNLFLSADKTQFPLPQGLGFGVTSVNPSFKFEEFYNRS